MTRATHDAIGWVRDTLQARILAQIFAQRVRGIVVKGGMALRIGHDKWSRATKDIDLDSTVDLPLATLQSIMRRAIRSATHDGLLGSVQVTEPKQTDTTARWKIAGVDPRTQQTMHLTVEVSRRNQIQPGDVHETLFGPQGGEMVTVYKDQVLAFQKVRALLSEQREAPRDIADLYLLIQASVQAPIPQLRAWFRQGGIAHVKDLWSKLDRMDHAMFRAEVLPTLPPTADGQALYQDWEAIRLLVGERIEQWMLAAGESEPAEASPSGATNPIQSVPVSRSSAGPRR